MANEFYRQIIHIGVGLTAVLGAVFLTRGQFLLLWGAVTVAYILSITLLKHQLRFVFAVLEREHAPFSGKGGLFFFLGVLFTVILFWDDAVLALLLLAIPDGLATLLAPLVKSPPLPYNHRKSVWGTTVFFVSAALILSTHFQQAAIFFVAFLLAAIESFDYREIPFLDDNLVIPVVAGFLLQFL